MSDRLSGAAATDESRAAAHAGGGEPLIEVRDLVKHFPLTHRADLPQPGRRRARRRRHLVRRHARRDARARRRVRLRQVDHRRGCCCGCSTRRRGSIKFEGEEIADVKRQAAEGAAPRHADDLPGPVLVAEPAQDGRLDHRRAVRHPRDARPARASASSAVQELMDTRRPQPRALQPLPARVLRRPAPAHRRRARARAEAEADRRRRAGLRARRLDPGAGAQPAARAPARPRADARSSSPTTSRSCATCATASR